MVQYFAENLDGFAVTQNGWVQSYGSRATRPSILWGDVSRPAPITVRWSTLHAEPHREAGQGDADRAGHDPRLVVRARRPAARRDREPGRARAARRDRRPRGGRHRHHPGRRAGAARAAAAEEARPGRLPRLVGRLVQAGDGGCGGQDADPHAPLLLGVRRGARRDRQAGCRRHVDRVGAVARRGRSRAQAQRIRPGHRPGRLRHPLAARAERRRGAGAARGGRRRDPAASGLGQPGLRPQDPRLRRDRGVAREHADGDACASGEKLGAR